MKWRLTIVCILICLPALAEEAVKPLRQLPPNVEIVNGKKFFSLQNAKRFTGGPNSPGALSVMHHPRAENTLSARRHFPAAGAPALAASAPAGSGTAPKPDANQVLSIFAPDDRGLQAALPAKK